MRLAVEVGAITSLGASTIGERRLVPITGGRFEGVDGDGLHWRGVVLPGGADRQFQRADGVLELDARYALQDTRGSRVQVVSPGLRHGPPEVITALYYFRTALRFETGAPHL